MTILRNNKNIKIDELNFIYRSVLLLDAVDLADYDTLKMVLEGYTKPQTLKGKVFGFFKYNELNDLLRKLNITHIYDRGKRLTYNRAWSDEANRIHRDLSFARKKHGDPKKVIEQAAFKNIFIAVSIAVKNHDIKGLKLLVKYSPDVLKYKIEDGDKTWEVDLLHSITNKYTLEKEESFSQKKIKGIDVLLRYLLRQGLNPWRSHSTTPRFLFEFKPNVARPLLRSMMKNEPEGLLSPNYVMTLYSLDRISLEDIGDLNFFSSEGLKHIITNQTNR